MSETVVHFERQGDHMPICGAGPPFHSLTSVPDDVTCPKCQEVLAFWVALVEAEEA